MSSLGQENITYNATWLLHTSITFLVDVNITNGVMNAVPTEAGTQVVINEISYLNDSALSNVPLMSIVATIKKTSDTTYRLFVYISDKNANANNINVTIDLSDGLKIDAGTLTNTNWSNMDVIDGRRKFKWIVGNLTGNGSKNITFQGIVSQEDMNNDYNYYWFLLNYAYNSSNTFNFGAVQAAVCLQRTINYHTPIQYQHGFTALAFFMAFILAILLVALVFFIYFLIHRKKSVSPSFIKHGKTKNAQDAARCGGIYEYSEGDSIVGVLRLKDKMQIHHEIDNLDIINTVNIDTSIEKEHNDASINTTELLLFGLQSNKDLDKGKVDAVLTKLRSRRVHIDNELDEEYQREMKKLYKKISAKNRAMMNTLQTKHRDEKRDHQSKMKDLPEKEKNKLQNLLNEQQTSELNAEEFRLKLEQDEETEKLRKEFAIRRHIAMKDLQKECLSDVKKQGNLTDEQMKWLFAEYQRNQKALDNMYDEEISKQRMILEEKLAKRKALAKACETMEDDNDYLLNTVASQEITTVEKMKKAKTISAADANVLIDQAKQEMMAIKDKMEKDRSDQENELHKRLSSLKKKRLNDLAKEHEQEIHEYDRKCQEMQTDAPLDPIVYAGKKLQLLSQQRVECSTLENEIDIENANELTQLRGKITTQTEADLRNVIGSMHAKIANDENAKQMLEKLLNEHKSETAALRASQKQNQEKQMRSFQDKLQQYREQWKQRQAAEKAEQQQLREYEDNVISKLLNSQVSMSEEERDRILKEHEKQMVKLENSLTLNKLRQKRMIEEKIALRRAQQMEKLQQNQEKEKEVQRRQMANATESGDEEAQKKQIELLKLHVEQKMALIQGRKMDWDAEFESVHIEMLKQRSLALKEQEERLGALVVELQLAKAKELAKIDEQQRAIHNLKANLIDDLNARGVLTDPQTQAVIKRHQEDQEKLTKRLDDQRLHQEKMLKEKLEMFLQQREKSMTHQQDEELKTLISPNKTAAKIRKMLLIHHHMADMEKMRNQLEREMSQTLEQVRYEYEVSKSRAIQNQEMEFIAGLVRVGKIPKEELESVIKILYPAKSDQEMKDIFNKIYDPSIQTNNQPVTHAQVSHLVSRVRDAHDHPPPFLKRPSQMSVGSLASGRNSSLQMAVGKKKAETYPPPQQQQKYFDDNELEDTSRIRPSSRMFEEGAHFQPQRQNVPIEANHFVPGNKFPFKDDRESGQRNAHEEEDSDIVTAQYLSDSSIHHQPPAKLPPLQTSTHKKKKKNKFLKKMASPRVHDDVAGDYDTDDDE